MKNLDKLIEFLRKEIKAGNYQDYYSNPFDNGIEQLYLITNKNVQVLIGKTALSIRELTDDGTPASGHLIQNIPIAKTLYNLCEENEKKKQDRAIQDLVLRFIGEENE